MTRFNYIITIHNREDLIERVLSSILVCAGADSQIYLVLDGCTDRTESVVDAMLSDWVGLPVTKLYAPDVHEIRSLNIALRLIPQEGDGYNILVQDDIIIRDRCLEQKVIAIHKHFANQVGVLSFRHGANVDLDELVGEVRESDVIESLYGQGIVDSHLAPGHAATRMVCMRSPQCVSFATIRKIGLLDEKYAPYTYDDYDYCLRCMKAGLINVVYALKVLSRIEWGGMRRSPQAGVLEIMKRNRRYVFQDHAGFIRSLRREDFQHAPVLIPVGAPNEDLETALRAYRDNKTNLKRYFLRRRLNVIRRLRDKLSR
jgi:glycosyltransferase involved in cell wall biosynthesis